MRSNLGAFLAILLCTSAATRALADASLTPLGILPGDTISGASGVSADGSVIVGTSVSISCASGWEAFRWTSGGGMVGLGYLPGDVFSAADGWTKLVVANGISADGNTIVGHGTRYDNTEGFVAVIPTIVPEPGTATITLLVMSSSVLLRRRSVRQINRSMGPKGARHRVGAIGLRAETGVISSYRRPSERSISMTRTTPF